MNILDAYSVKAAHTIWKENPNNEIEYLGAGKLFPFAWQNTHDLAFARGHKGLPVSLVVSDYDAKATFRDRIGLMKIETEMPYFKEGFILKAGDIVKINNAQNQADVFLKDALKNIYEDDINLIKGAYVVPERQIFQLLAPTDGTPKINMGTADKNYSYNYDPDGEWKAKNFIELTGADKWSDFENSKPYDDIEELLEHASDNGDSPTRAIMSSKTFKYLKKNKDIHSRILAQNTTANIYLTDTLVKNFLETDLNISIIVYKKKFVDEAGATKAFMPDDIITFIPENVLGETRFAPTPEQLANQANQLEMVDGRIALSLVLGTGNPASIETIASMVVLPSFEGMDSVYVMKV